MENIYRITEKKKEEKNEKIITTNQQVMTELSQTNYLNQMEKYNHFLQINKLLQSAD